MSIPELGYRAGQAGCAWAERIGFAGARHVPSACDLSNLQYQFDVGAKIDIAAYTTAADRLLAGELNVFSLRPAHIGYRPHWNRDPLTGIEAPLQFGQHLSLTDKAVMGDIKYLWEPNRHLHLVTLAQAYHLTGEQRFLDGIALQITSWLEQCPYLMGANWSSSLEPAIRLINWSLTWQMIGGASSPMFAGQQGESFRQQWLVSVYQHCHFVSRHFSRYSSANNHLVGELAGLYLAADTWPAWPESRTWMATAKRLLVAEILVQNSSDGVNLEQAIAYQQFALDFFLLCGLAGKKSGDEFPAAYWQRIENMMTFLASIMDASGNVPSFGDADDGFVVRLHTAENFSPYQSLLATGAVLFGRGDFKAKTAGFDEKSLWLLGQQGAEGFAQLDSSGTTLPVRFDFPDGGYHIIGSDFGTENEIRLVLDCAPLGYLGIAAHGHADALSFVLSVGGKEMLVDPGTYAYHAELRWRNYFRGTSAHNTVRIDGLDQSLSGGRFMWLNKAQSVCEQMTRDQATTVFVGTHDGYLRLADPVRHQRKIEFDAQTRRIVVTDSLACLDQHRVEIYWHFSGDCSVEIVDGLAVARRDGKQVAIHMPEQLLIPSLLKGSEEPISGWVSPSYDIKFASFSLCWRGTITGPISLRTVLEIT